jgi:hypothetical protein
MSTAFGGGIQFLERLGIYDVVLPFLLVFTLVYAFLEKTKVLGVETYYSGSDHKNKWEAPRRNLNSMVAFVVAFFVIASSQIVAIINKTLSHMVVLLVVIFSFILVAGSFQKETKEGFFLEDNWKKAFMFVSLAGIILIFLNAMGWLDRMWRSAGGIWNNEATASLILIVLIIGFILWITKDPGGGKGEKKKD